MALTSVEYNGIMYNEVEVESFDVVADAETVKAFSPNFCDDGACILNAYNTAKITTALCVEGFVICKVLPANITVIRHCWNKIADRHLDVTKDFIWDKRNIKTIYNYFPVAEFHAIDYNPEKKEVFEIAFLSDVVNIAQGVKDEIYDELGIPRDTPKP
jgi:hypothetical protein